MRDTSDIATKMLAVWKEFDAGKVTAIEARVHIGIARTLLDAKKVEIAAAHLNNGHVPPVEIVRKPPAIVTRRESRRTQ